MEQRRVQSGTKKGTKSGTKEGTEWDKGGYKEEYQPVEIVVVDGVSRNGAELLAKTAEHLRREDVSSAAAEAQLLHGLVNDTVKHLRQLCVVVVVWWKSVHAMYLLDFSKHKSHCYICAQTHINITKQTRTNTNKLTKTSTQTQTHTRTHARTQTLEQHL